MSVTLAETPVALPQVKAVWDIDERAAPVDFIARSVESGDMVLGTGSMGKVRWSRAVKAAERGRYCFYHHADAPINLLLARAKACKTAAKARVIDVPTCVRSASSSA